MLESAALEPCTGLAALATVTVTLQPTDSGTLKTDGSSVGVVVETAHAVVSDDYMGEQKRFFFLEHRTSSTGYLAGQSNALVMNWMDVSEEGGNTGIYGTGDEHMILTDCSEWTTSDSNGHDGFDDAGCIVGQVKTIDVGTPAESRPVDVKVVSIDGDLVQGR